MKKGFLGLIIGLIIGLVISSGGIAYSNPMIKLIVDGRTITTDTPPQIINGRVMVPVRVIAEQFGANVNWDATNRTVYISSKTNITPSNQTSYPLEINKQEMHVKARKLIDLSNDTITIVEKDIKDVTYNEVQDQINKLIKFEEDLIAWGVLDEFKGIKQLYIKCVREQGEALLCVRSALGGLNPHFNMRMAEQYMMSYQGTCKAIEAEYRTLELKGHL